jgi:hypothetical protein
LGQTLSWGRDYFDGMLSIISIYGLILFDFWRMMRPVF